MHASRREASEREIEKEKKERGKRESESWKQRHSDGTRAGFNQTKKIGTRSQNRGSQFGCREERVQSSKCQYSSRGINSGK